MKRWLLRIALTVLLLVLLASGALWWSQQGVGLAHWSDRAGVRTEGLQGSLWSQLAIDRVLWRGSDGASLELRSVRWQRLGLGWSAGRAHLQGRLEIGQLVWHGSKHASPPFKPEELLQLLRLPLDLDLDGLRIGALQVDGQALPGLHLPQLRARRDPLWELELAPTTWAGGQAQGRARLQSDGGLSGQARWQHAGYDALEMQARGTLAQLGVELKMGAALQAQARLQPLAAQPLQSLRAELRDLDLKHLHPQAPRTALKGQIQAQVDAQARAELELQLSNAAARRLDQGGWPLRAAQARLSLDLHDWRGLRLHALELDLGDAGRSAGLLKLQQAMGLPDPDGGWNAKLALQSLQLRELDAQWPQARLAGSLQLQQSARHAPLELDLRSALQQPQLAGLWSLEAQARVRGERPEALKLQLQGPRGQLLKGQAQWQQPQLNLQAHSEGEWTLPWGPWGPQAQRLELDLEARLHLSRLDLASLRAASGQAELKVREGSRWAGLPAQGRAQWQHASGQPATLELALQSGAQHLELALREDEHWQPRRIDARLPDLAALKPWWQPWLSELAGALELQADPSRLQLQARQFALRPTKDSPRWSLAQLNASGTLDAARVQSRIELKDLQQGGTPLLPTALLQIDGPREAQRWQLQAEALAAGRRWRLAAKAQAQGRWAEMHWRELEASVGPNDAKPWLELQGATLDWLDEQVRLAPTTLRVAGQRLDLEQAQWSPADWRLQLKGQPQLQSWLQAFTDLDWQGDLQAALGVQLQGGRGRALHGELDLHRVSGDLRLPDDSGQARALEIQTLELRLRRQPDGALSVFRLDSRAHGQLQFELRVADDGRLQGGLKASLPTLQALDPWLSGGLQLRGRAQAELVFGGRREQPLLNGVLRAEQLGLQHPASGFACRDGELQLDFEGERASLRRVRLAGIGDQGGSFDAQGQASWQGEARLDLQLKAEALRVLQRFDRELVVSGQTQLALRPYKLEHSGSLRIDQGRFDLGRSDAPKLGEDVQVVRAGVPPSSRTAGNPWQTQVDLKLDLGERLSVRGRGLQTRLTGQLQWQQQTGKPARFSGKVESNGGHYRAYGQDLEIETGVLVFDKGVLDDPRLDLLAVRPELEQRVGVRVDGRALQPRVRLYSDPALPDTEALSWLLLGRAPDELGRNDAALLQRAALALLAGEGESPAAELLGKLGLTELSLSPNDEGERVLRLGAQLGKRWSLAYERSLGQTTGSWQLAYRLGQRFTLRAKSGEDAGLDLLWLWRFD